MKDGSKPEYPEKTPDDDEHQKRHVIKVEIREVTSGRGHVKVSTMTLVGCNMA